MKRIVFGILAATLALLVIIVPALAAYWAYLVIEETNGTTYSELPVIALRNVTQLANYGIITSTGLDTRVLTGDGEVLPHMLADDRVCTVTDLAALEKKQLIFYTGATSLSSFKIIIGYGGNITTPDVDELELGYVMEVLASGYFNAANGSDKNILYKDDAFRVWVSAINTLRVAALNSTGDEQWEMHYSNFTTGYHTVYIVCNGLYALLYVDTFDVAKDTVALYDHSDILLYSGTEPLSSWGEGQLWSLLSMERRTFYGDGRYWAFYLHSGNLSTIFYRTSQDGASWDVEQSIALAGGAIKSTGGFSVWQQQGTDYFHIVYEETSTSDVYYRKGYAEANGTITWSAAWQQITKASLGNPQYGEYSVKIATDNSGYPFIAYIKVDSDPYSADPACVIKSSTNNGTWTMEGGYPVEWAGLYAYYQDAREINIIGYPNSTKMYVVWGRRDGTSLMTQRDVYARYYNGASWAGASEIIEDASSPTGFVYGLSAIADNNDNVYIVYTRDGTTDTLYLRIRYADGSFSSIIPIATGVDDAWCSASYDPNHDIVCLFYISSGYVMFQYLVLGEATLHGPYSLCSTGQKTLTSSPYGSNMGVLFQDSGEIDHVLVSPNWVWNDNNEDWYWMQNNVMPYADLLEIAVNGTIHLKYEPADIVHGNTMPDSSNATGNDGIVNWGENPPGVSAYLTPIESDEGSPAPTIAPTPSGTSPGDMVGPTGQPGTSQTLPTLPSNPLYPFLSPLATLSGIPLGIMWILFATFLVVIAMLLTYKYVPHLFMTILVGCGLTAFFYHMGIYPFWVMIIVAIGGFAAIIAERMPSVD